MCKYWVKPAKSRIHFRSKSLASEVFSAKLIKTSSKHPLDHFNLWQFYQVIYGCPKHWKQLRLRPVPPGRSTRTSKRPALSPGHRNTWGSEIGGHVWFMGIESTIWNTLRNLFVGENCKLFGTVLNGGPYFFVGHKKRGFPHFWTESSGWELLTILGQVGAIRCVPIF